MQALRKPVKPCHQIILHRAARPIACGNDKPGDRIQLLYLQVQFYSRRRNVSFLDTGQLKINSLDVSTGTLHDLIVSLGAGCGENSHGQELMIAPVRHGKIEDPPRLL